MKRIFLGALAGALCSTSSWAHPGKVDSYGCHPNMAHGTFHCHQEPYAGRVFENREKMRAVLDEDDRRRQSEKLKSERLRR